MRYILRGVAYIILLIFILISLMCVVMVRNTAYPSLKDAMNNSKPITPGSGIAASYIKPFDLYDFIIICLISGLGIIGVVAAIDMFVGAHEEEFEPYQYPNEQRRF